MALTEPTRATAWEDSGVTCMARVVGNDGENIAQADLTKITCKSYDLDGADPDTATTHTVTVSSAVSDTLVTDDSRWTEDSTGYNFIHTVPGTAFATGDHRYRIEYVFDPVSGEDFVVVFEVFARAIKQS